MTFSLHLPRFPNVLAHILFVQELGNHLQMGWIQTYSIFIVSKLWRNLKLRRIVSKVGLKLERHLLQIEVNCRVIPRTKMRFLGAWACPTPYFRSIFEETVLAQALMRVHKLKGKHFPHCWVDLWQAFFFVNYWSFKWLVFVEFSF